MKILITQCYFLKLLKRSLNTLSKCLHRNIKSLKLYKPNNSQKLDNAWLVNLQGNLSSFLTTKTTDFWSATPLVGMFSSTLTTCLKQVWHANNLSSDQTNRPTLETWADSLAPRLNNQFQWPSSSSFISVLTSWHTKVSMGWAIKLLTWIWSIFNQYCEHQSKR